MAATTEAFRGGYQHFRMDQVVGERWAEEAAASDPALELPLELQHELAQRRQQQ